MSALTALPLLSNVPAAKAGFRLALYEGVGAAPLPGPARAELLQALLAGGHAVTVIRAHQPAPRRHPEAGVLLVLGQFDAPQPAVALDAAGEVEVRFLDIRDMPKADTLAAVAAVRAEVTAPANPATGGGWKPWFPVIDYDRCTNCMQCLSFCLFDVYGVSSEKKIQVQNQTKCKTDCPACSRVCPEVAILFPKYRHGPINGDVVSADDLRREAMKVDISALLGGDIYQALRDRSAKSKSRFAKERDEDRALEERQKCLVKLGEKLDIPAEVFSSLPSIDQIRAKADEAAARADAARLDLATTQASPS